VPLDEFVDTPVRTMATPAAAGAPPPVQKEVQENLDRFVRPVFIGDTVTATTEITAVHDHRYSPDRLGRVDELVTVVNQRWR